MKVWVCEEGEYENCGVVGIYSSLETGINHIKARFGSPYKVTWEQHEEELQGSFEAVPGYSIKHIAYFGFTEYEVDNP